MIRPFIGKFLESAAVLIVISMAVFLLIGLMPGDPVDIMLAANPHATAEDAARLRAIYGLDRPLWARYGEWAMQFLSGDLGHSRLFNQPVTALLGAAFLNTLTLLGSALFCSLCIALPLGVWSGYRPDSRAARVINVLCYAGISVPPLWLGLLLLSVFSVGLGLLPAGGMPPEGAQAAYTRFPGVAYYVLPVAALTLASVGGYIRYIRAGMIEALTADHIRTARAKGLPESRVILRHALPMAMIPVVTVVALDFGALFSGAVITETIFNWRGMGRLVYDAIMGNDFHLALSALMIITALIVLANMAADFAYRMLDPRIRSAADRMSGKSGDGA